MNAKFLKTVGASSMKDFHTKYPDEKVFIAKCGAKIKKAYPGIKIPKGEAEYGAFFSQLLADGTEAAKGVKVKKAQWGGLAMGGAEAGGAGGAGGGILESLTGGEGATGAINKLGGIGNIANKIGGFIDARKAAKEAVQVAKQDSLVFEKLEDAQSSNKVNEQFNLQQARQDSYVRPEDNVLTGEELFPMYGVGTNVLAKDGAKIKANNGMFLGSTGQQWGQVGKEALGTGFNEISKRLNFAPDDVGGQIGADVGGMAGGLIGGPVGEMVGKVAGKFIGDGLDRTDTQRKKYEERTERSQNNMIGMQIGDRIQGNFGGNLKNGGSYEMGGDVQTFGDGNVSPLSNNPYAGEMGMINGPSHEKGGVPMKIYSDPQINAKEGVTLEAEGGEPIMKTRDEGLSPIDGMAEGGQSTEEMTILGNRFVPSHIKKAVESFSGEKFKGTKYKNIGKEVGKTESKLTSDIENYANKTKEYSDFREIDLISKGSLSLMSEIKDAKLKKLALVRDVLSQSQEAINEQEEDSRNTSIDARKGKTIYAQEGTTFKNEQEAIDAGYEKQQDGRWRIQTQEGEDWGSIDVPNVIQEGTPDKTITTKKKTRSWQEGYKNRNPEDTDLDFAAWKKKAQAWKKDNPTAYETKTVIPGEERVVEDNQIDLGGTEDLYEYADIAKQKDKQKIDWAGLIGGANLIGTDAEAFRNSQLLPEAWAMANNKLEPVQAQKFQPRLRVPYDISLQDQLNEVTASAKSAERMAAYNPEVLAGLKAQEYMADSKILGDQFRQNQQFKDQVYSGNLQTLNEAQLKNLAIADTQYTRQEKAKSITKATDFEAIKSMTDKRAKHALENQTLRVMENLYNYRFDPAGRAQYRGEGFNPKDMWGTGMAGNQAPAGMEMVGWSKTHGPTFRPIKNSTSKQSKAEIDPFISGGGFGGGLSKNGSIVKKYKKFK